MGKERNSYNSFDRINQFNFNFREGYFLTERRKGRNLQYCCRGFAAVATRAFYIRAQDVLITRCITYTDKNITIFCDELKNRIKNEFFTAKRLFIKIPKKDIKFMFTVI